MSALTPRQTKESLAAMNHRLRLLAPFLADPDVQEIAVNRPGEVWLWKRGLWVRVVVAELDYGVLDAIGANLANYVSKPFDRTHTSLSAHLPSGERIEMTHPPTAPESTIYLNVRKHAGGAFPHGSLVAEAYYANTRHDFALNLSADRRAFYAQHISDDERTLWELACGGQWASFVERAIGLYQNIVVSGATGCGKTSYIRSLIELIDPADRLITVEDTPEMPLNNHPNSNALFYRKATDGEGAGAEDVVHSCMRKTPTRVILAELRGAEAMFYLAGVLSSGHPGGLTTTHANTTRDAYVRLALLIKSSPTGQGIDLATIQNMLYMTVNVVVQLKFDRATGRRFVPSIYYDPMYRLSLLT
ncbi:ATPase, T2SS/T4P/T4SS family [Massilia sp. R2A-15]|uniref:ATPase, T2SS/T4P/T4SS family n=1 Tax=Massilia sp. R2A-15 TaxID=3064278 RepID=UPI002734EE98|nr:ATPase, T2SS/T4P/T4SS family [Massilia sp. R2A-15]WLI87818.1 ATPase, T2SS/T4P/T4SS family [Massilia sp. R2A-15]